MTVSIRQCKFDGCGNHSKAKGFCSTHYERQRRTGSAELVSRPSTEVCTVEGCGLSTRSTFSEYCEKHYMRMRRNGTLQLKYESRPCQVDGCTVTAKPVSGYCRTHQLRVKRRNDPHFEFKGANMPQWTGDDASYAAVHTRLRKSRGPATRYSCVDCDGVAKQWSYDHCDPNGKNSELGSYSTNLDHYFPRCVSCHKRHDLALVRARA